MSDAAISNKSLNFSKVKMLKSGKFAKTGPLM